MRRVLGQVWGEILWALLNCGNKLVHTIVIGMNYERLQLFGFRRLDTGARLSLLRHEVQESTFKLRGLELSTKP
jgi:hypothetical protein